VSRGAIHYPVGALRNSYDHMVAAQFLAEAAYPMPETREWEAERLRWRERWGPWLSGVAPGPIGNMLAWHLQAQQVELSWRARDAG
jgi:hypothetical protein